MATIASKWPLGSTFNCNGYRKVKVQLRPPVWRYQHRVVMEEFVARDLTTDEHVHHINGDKADNRPENLELVSSSEHSRRHATVPGWSRDHAACLRCGGTRISHNAGGLCVTCYSIRRRASDR